MNIHLVVFGQLTVSVTRGKDETRIAVQGGSCAFLLFTEKAQTNYIYKRCEGRKPRHTVFRGLDWTGLDWTGLD